MLMRVMAGTGANAFGQATTIAIQLISLPAFLSVWDLTTYGQWIVLSAVPTYVAMADVGMVTAAGNRMTMLIGQGDRPAASQAFQSVAAFVLAVCSVIVALSGLVLSLLPDGAFPTSDSRLSLALLVLATTVALIGGLPEAAYRATGRYALGSTIATIGRLAEWLGSLVGLWLSGTFVAVAAGALLGRTVLTVAMVLHAYSATKELEWGFARARWAEVRSCARPALSFMLFPAANALSFQGMTLVAAAAVGPAGTVLFNTYRTIARVTVQATGIFSHALWPEFSRMFGAGSGVALRAVYRRSVTLTAGLSGIASVLVFAVSSYVLEIWSKGKVDFHAPLMLLAMAYATAAGLWHVSRVLLLATNEHGSFARWFLAASIVTLPLAYGLALRYDVYGILLAMLGMELAMLALSSSMSRRLLCNLLPMEPVEARA